MGVKRLLSSELAEETKSILAYAILSSLVIGGLKYFGILTMTFNLVPLTLLIDYVITIFVMLGIGITVEYLEPEFKIDRLDKTEQYTIGIASLIFFPILLVLGQFGVLTAYLLNLTNLQNIVIGMFLMIGIQLVTWTIAIAGAVEIVK